MFRFWRNMNVRIAMAIHNWIEDLKFYHSNRED